jgi:hypothetical protein
MSSGQFDAPIMQHTAHHKDVLPSSADNNWKKQPDTFTGDDVIDAYLQGKKEGQSEYSRVLLSQLKTNIALAKKVAEDLFAQMGNAGVIVMDAYLKAEGITNFNILIIVSESDFLDDRFRSVFSLARKVKEQSLNDNFHVSFTFMPHSSNLNRACIHADGYFLKYEKAGSLP